MYLGIDMKKHYNILFVLAFLSLSTSAFAQDVIQPEAQSADAAVTAESVTAESPSGEVAVPETAATSSPSSKSYMIDEVDANAAQQTVEASEPVEAPAPQSGDIQPITPEEANPPQVDDLRPITPEEANSPQNPALAPREDYSAEVAQGNDNDAPANDIPVGYLGQSPQDDNAAASDNSNEQPPQKGWRSGASLYAGVGPAFDLLDDATGYSSRIGFDGHWTYIGIGLEVTWNMIWAKEGTKRSDHNDVAYRTTNSGIMAMVHGFIPPTDHLVIKLGAGIGLGVRYEITFSDEKNNEWVNSTDSSWLARLQAGVLWLFDSNLTVGVDFEFNFGGYVEPVDLWWSDKEDDTSFGLVFNFSYVFME